MMRGTPKSAAALGLALMALLGVECGAPTAGTGKPPSPSVATTPAQGSPTAAPSGSPATSPSSSPTTPPIVGAFGVLVTAQSGSSYTISLVGTDGRVVASAPASTPNTVTCANAAAGVVPLPVSTSNTRAYFMDAQGAVRTIGPTGGVSSGAVVSLPTGPARRSLFAVSPDDSQMAVVVIDFVSGGATTKLYMYQLQAGGSQTLLFSESGAYTLWPTGWHGTNNLVVAKVPACTQGGGPGCCGPQELHVIDPATAVRRFTIGGPTCIIAGAPSPTGAVCETSTQAEVLSWTAATVSSFAVSGYTPAYLSPDGQLVAVVANGAPTTTLYPTNAALNLIACGWIDSSHVLSGGDVQHQPSVGNVNNGQVVPVAAQGDCAGRIPGGL